MLDPDVNVALQTFLQKCEAFEHSLCGQSMACTKGWLAYQGTEKRRQREFDAAHSLMTVVNEMPGHHWPTTTLLAYARHHLLAQPNICGLWRGTAITTALGRLAERGIPADCVVRTCVGPELLRRILVIATSMLSETRLGRCDRQNVPELESWFRLLETDSNISEAKTIDPDLLAVTALRGKVRDQVEEWLATASITHILGWRIEDPLKVDVDESALSIAGGIGASKWLYERSIITHPGEWSGESRQWESAFLADPEAISRRTGISLEILNERQVSHQELDRSYVDVALGNAVPIEVDGMSGQEIFEMILSLLACQALRPARTVARRASERYPDNDGLRLIYAFCTIPFQAARASEILDGLSEGAAATAPAIIDRATISLVTSSVIDVATFSTCSTKELDSSYWLWDPTSFPNQPSVIYITPREWLERAAKQLPEGLLLLEE